jgi:hypothetical protein
MNVRVFNGPGSGTILARPPNVFVTAAAAGYQDIDEGTAKSIDNVAGFQCIGYVGPTSGRPPTIPVNGMGLDVYIDTSLGIVVAQDGSGNWRNVVTGAIS